MAYRAAAPNGREIGAFVLDMDGVVTDTAEPHFAAWKHVFDDFLCRHAAGEAFRPFTRADYLAHVDGIPRRDGIRRFLGSRGIELPEGDAGRAETVAGIAARKNDRFNAWLDKHEVPVFTDAIALIQALRRLGIGVGIFSASRNARRVLESARLLHIFEAVLDGAEAAAAGLAGKPDPAMPVETAHRLGSQPVDAVIVEDAALGVEAGARGGFALVVGVNRQGAGAWAQARSLRDHGADLVTDDLRDLLSPDGLHLGPLPWRAGAQRLQGTAR